jgi:hypothetical protein
MKRESNPPLNIGDQIMCYHMEGETSVPPGTLGVVTRISKDPFEHDEVMYSVKWDNGSNLSLISSTDIWKKTKENVQESRVAYEFFVENSEIFDLFDWRFLRKFLYKLRDSGVINMFQSSPFLYSGKNWIDRYYGENQEDNESFQEVLEMADKSKDKMVQGLLKYMESKGLDFGDMDKVNNLIHRFANKIVNLYISFD